MLIPSTGAIPKINVYFLVDTPGSMTSVIDAVKAGADDILRKLAQEAAGMGARRPAPVRERQVWTPAR